MRQQLSALDAVFNASLTGDRAVADDLGARSASAIGTLGAAGNSDVSGAADALASTLAHRTDHVTLPAMGALEIMGRVTGVFKSDRTYFVTTAGTAQGIPIFTIEGNPIGVTLERVIDSKRSGILGTLAAGSIQVMANLAMEAYDKGEKP